MDANLNQRSDPVVVGELRICGAAMDIDDVKRPEIARAIYMFAERLGDCYLPRQIGHAKSPEEGVPSVEQFTAAAAAGCSHVLVHDAPSIFTDLAEIERRLVATFDPVMNKRSRE